MDRLAFCFGVHNHQPIGNFDHVMVEATERAYRPFLERLDQRPEVRLSVHCTGSLLEWLRDRSPRTFDLLGTVAARGQVELLTGGFYEPILAVLPDHDKIGQVERLTTFLKSNFGVRPRGMWLAERVWEPHLPRVLSEAGVEYVLVDDRHFALAGLDVDTLGGYYLTDEQGQSLRVFPINQRLRYLIPFAGVDEVFEYLAAWGARARDHDGRRRREVRRLARHLRPRLRARLARPLLRSPPVHAVARADDPRRRRRARTGDRPRVSADRLVRRDGGVGAVGRGGARAWGGQGRDQPAGRRPAAGRTVARWLLAELPRQVSRGRRRLLEDAAPFAGDPRRRRAAPRRHAARARSGRALAGSGQRRLLARCVRRLLSPASAPRRENVAPGSRALAGP